jgi:hypothetical protein
MVLGSSVPSEVLGQPQFLMKFTIQEMARSRRQAIHSQRAQRVERIRYVQRTHQIQPAHLGRHRQLASTKPLPVLVSSSGRRGDGS